MGILLFVFIIILLIVGVICVYKTAEVHELHKMRASFSDIKRHIEAIKIEYEKNQDIPYIDYGNGKLDGELEEIDEVIDIINDELESLKTFDLGNSD